MILKSNSFSKKTFQAVGNGFCYSIRPIEQADKQKLIKLFNHLSPENRYLRFAHAISKLPGDFLDDVLELDYQKEMALVALIEQDCGIEEIIGISRYITQGDSLTCEFSLTVSDRYSAHGVGSNLMNLLIDYARAQGLKRMLGYVLVSNVSMLRLVKALGFQTSSSIVGSDFKEVTLDL